VERRWLFGDQLGSHFLDGPSLDGPSQDGPSLDQQGSDQRGQPALIIESRAVFARRRFHRAKAHLVLSAMRHRAAELGDSVLYVRADTYREGLAGIDEPLSVCRPTSWAADRLVRSLAAERDLEILPARGFFSTQEEFQRWAGARGRRRLLMEDFYRDSRTRSGILMDGAEPAGGRWNYDEDNREGPPLGGKLDVPDPFRPVEDEIDDEVRADLDRWERAGDVTFVGDDGPRRFAATRTEALSALEVFVEGRLAHFGPIEDAMLAGEPWMSHSMLSAPMNLGLLDPHEVVDAAEAAYRDGRAPLNSVEGFVRQVMGWRDYIWHLYWHLGEDYRTSNALDAHHPMPDWLADLDAEATEAACLRGILTDLRRDGWLHHIPRLMVLGNWMLAHGIDPAAATDWFHRCFVDGYDWVMVPNVVGMSQHADHGVLATKPYAAGGAYINRMSDYCGGCRFDPRVRVGPKACPFTASYWTFIDAHADDFRANHRMARAVGGLSRLKDLDALRLQEQARGTAAP
jgi:deoxyribodipyrimidine photolyase-related protein